MFTPNLDIACPSVFQATRWVRRKLTASELCRMWDLPLNIDKTFSTDMTKLLPTTISPLVASSVIRCLWAIGGEVSSDTTRSETNHQVNEAVIGNQMSSKGSLALEIAPSSKRQAAGSPLSGSSIPTSHLQDTENALFANIRQQHDIAKAVKSDDAEVPVHLWDNFISRGNPVSHALANRLMALRKVAMRWYQRKLTKSCIKFIEIEHGSQWVDTLKQLQRDRKWANNIAAIREIVSRAANNDWFEYPAGSRAHFFRFPHKYRSTARDGVPVHFTKPGPTTIKAQLNMKEDEKAVLKNKLLKMRKKRYLDIPPRKLNSAIKYFAVPKRVLDGVVQDWRIVYHAGANGLNDSVWAPSFWLPNVESLLRLVDETSFMEDRDVGEMFLNFELHHSVRKFTGVDLKPLGFSMEECPPRWVWWTKNLMGFRSSPYNSVKMYSIAEEVIRGDRRDDNNPFQWSDVELNLPGTRTYNPTQAWISKRRKDGTLASDIVVFVDDKRLMGSGSERTKCYSTIPSAEAISERIPFVIGNMAWWARC